MSASPKVTHPALYRVTQFFVALKAVLLASGGLTTADKVIIASILTTPAQQYLFAQMSPNDQRHALAVACTLQRAGYDQPALLQAALLHDVAKSMGQPLVHRVLIVLLKAFWPAVLERISESVNPQMANPEPKAPCEQGKYGKWRVNYQYSLIRPFTHSPIPNWRRPFVIHAHHPAIGAAWAEEAGCEALAIKLIAKHQEMLKGEPVGEEEKLLAALQWADDLN